jgi:hypothetical protein
MDMLEEDKVKRTAERIIIVFSSLGAFHNNVFKNTKKLLRNDRIKMGTNK